MLAHGESIQEEKNIVTSSSLEQRGKQLRAAIEQAYKNLVDTKTLSSKRGNNITEVVVQYIPVGTSFDDAEQILRNAGFKVYPRPNANPTGTRPDRYDVVGAIDSFDWKRFLSKVSVWVNLSPQAPGNYGKVNKVYSGITLSTL
jgi:hypothetical protein